MNKRHWITVDLALGGFPDEVRQLIDESWVLVAESLPKSHPARASLVGHTITEGGTHDIH